MECYLTHAKLIHALAQQNLDSDNKSTMDNSETEEGEVQGGPKTQEPPMEDVPERHLLEEIDFCPDLSESNKKALQEVVLNHKDAFGLDVGLGNYCVGILISCMLSVGN